MKKETRGPQTHNELIGSYQTTMESLNEAETSEVNLGRAPHTSLTTFLRPFVSGKGSNGSVTAYIFS